MSRIPAFSIVGYKKTGKTTLVSRLVRELKARGYRVGTLKHDAHEFQMDTPHTDTFKHREAGADVVAIASTSRWAVLAWEDSPPSLSEMLERIQGVDLILVEGFKQEPLPKIVIADEQGTIFQKEPLSNVIAVAAEGGVANLARLDVPVYDRNEIEKLADLLIALLDRK